MLLAACSASMANALAVLAGTDLSFLEMCAFCATGMAVLFLAAERGSSDTEKKQYFGVFMLLLVSYMLGGALGFAASAAVWPLLLAAEQRRGGGLEQPMRLVCFAEAVHLALVLLAGAGGFEALRFFANLFWLLLAGARGWAALVLYKTREDA